MSFIKHINHGYCHGPIQPANQIEQVPDDLRQSILYYLPFFTAAVKQGEGCPYG